MANGTPLETDNRPAPTYCDIDTLSNANKLIAIISWRRANGAITFCVMKTFERDGVTERTNFIPDGLADSYLELSALTVKRVKEIAADPVLLDRLLTEAGMPAKYRVAQKRQTSAGR
jgi:hypothetical protein